MMNNTMKEARKDYYGTAMFARRKKLNACVQNFAIFNKEDGPQGLYMVTGVSSSNKTTMELSKLNTDTMNFEIVGNGIGVGNGHGNSVEVVLYNNAYYLVYVEDVSEFEELFENTAVAVACRKMEIRKDGWSLGEVKYIELFPEYKTTGEKLYSSMITFSENFVCIASSYGSNLKNDTERYHIYEKADFMRILTGMTGNKKSQGDFNECRCGTGMFSGDDSLGLDISKTDAVLQCIALGEKGKNATDEAPYVTVWATVDNRPKDEKDENGRTKHRLCRVKIRLKAVGKPEANNAQDLSKGQRCYYSPIDMLQYGTFKIPMNYKSGTEEKERFELEGIKQLSDLEKYGIKNGWYISVNCSLFRKVEFKEDFNHEKPANLDAIPWNCMIYFADTAPTFDW